MLVSGFHLEFAGAWDARNPAYTSGYELEITNLSGQHIDFEVVAKVTRYASGTIFSPPESPATKLANLKRLIPGVLKDDRWSWFDGGWRHDSGGYSLHITMPIDAGASQLFYMNPSIYESNKSWWPRVAGHIELTIPAVRAAEPPYEWIPQADGPVPVLLNPSTVETWDVVTGAAGGAFSHSRTTPPLTTGQARVEIPPGYRSLDSAHFGARLSDAENARCYGCDPHHRRAFADGSRAGADRPARRCRRGRTGASCSERSARRTGQFAAREPPPRAGLAASTALAVWSGRRESNPRS